MTMLTLAESPAAYNESALATLWQRAHTLADALITEGGRRMRVLYPGRPSARAGPDFRDAVLQDEEGRTITGDIELHTTAPGWYAHGHHADPNYNGVVLHVVFSPKGHADTRTRSGISAPIVALEAVADRLANLSDESPDAATPNIPSLDALRNAADITAKLDAAGDARFLAKSHGFALDIAQVGANEALYRGIMDALGYASNRKPFRILAQRVPYSTLAQLGDEPPATRLLAIKALLLGASGLMRRVSDDENPTELRRLYRRLPKHPFKPNAPLSEKDWKLFRVRPSNHPARRIIGMARILADCMDDSISEKFAADLLQGAGKALAARMEHRPHIGKGRARDMLINIALPFLHAHAAERGNGELADAAQAAYATAPKLQENEITREMRRLLNIGKEVKMTARRQQGMIGLYRETINVSYISGLEVSLSLYEVDRNCSHSRDGYVSSTY